MLIKTSGFPKWDLSWHNSVKFRYKYSLHQNHFDEILNNKIWNVSCINLVNTSIKIAFNLVIKYSAELHQKSVV